METSDQLVITGLRGRISQLCRNIQRGAAQQP
jgi:hypothetical protein